MPEQLDADLRTGAKAAAAAAAVGAAVGVARAIAARADEAAHRPRADANEPPEEQEEQEEEEEQFEPEQPEDEEPEDEQEQEEAQEPEHAQAQRPERVRAQEQPEEEKEDRAPAKGEGADRLRRLTETARDLLQELSGAEVETVSALDRTPNGWRVTLEAIEVRRIPDSTDVLATYDVELDDDGDLVRYERGRRYSRAQSDHGDDR